MNKKSRQKSTAVLAGIFFLFFVMAIISAAETPVLPTIVKGTATIDNSPAPIGTRITATIDSILLGETNTTKEGEYIIAVGGEIENTGKTIDIYIDGLKAETNISWSSGSMNTQDLEVTKKNNNYLYALIAAVTCLIAFFVLKTRGKKEK